MKLSSEFIAGVAVGAGLGWGIDRLAGTSPWGLIVFLLLGFPLPALLLYAGQPALAFLVQYAGLLAERWLFFADARHPQNLYYQSIA